jgi:hypothetical protein
MTSVKNDSADPDDTTGIAALIDYRGRAAAFLGLFPVHPRIHALLRRYAHWVPDTFVRRCVWNRSESVEIHLLHRSCLSYIPLLTSALRTLF